MCEIEIGDNIPEGQYSIRVSTQPLYALGISNTCGHLMELLIVDTLLMRQPTIMGRPSIEIQVHFCAPNVVYLLTKVVYMYC